MAYIGKQPLVGNFIKLDAITASATDTYNLLHDSVAYTPQSAMNCIVSLNGVIQAPITAYTIVGTTIVFSETLSASDTIDFIVVLGDVLDVGTVSDDTISTAKIKDLNVTAGKLAATQDLSTKTITLPASVSGLGTGITNAQLAGSITDAKITGLSSSKLSGALPAISGASLTSLNASNIGSGTVPTARLGTGTASSTTVLYGDQTYKAEPGGGLLQVKQVQITDTASRSGESWAEFDTDFRVVITPTLSTSKILLMLHANVCMTDEFAWLRLIRTVSASDTAIAIGDAIGSTRHRATLGNIYRKVNNYYVTSQSMTWLDAPATTSEITYKVENWASATMYLNRQVTDGDDENSATAVSTITAIEIATGVL